MIYIGIDPGLSGAIAAINEIGSIIYYGVMPTTGTGKGEEIDVARLADTLQDYKAAVCCLEKVGAMPKQGVSSTFKFGKGFGQIDATLKIVGLPFSLVTPQAWKKRVLAGLDWKGNKAASIQYCLNRYPGYDFRRTARCKNQHDGICDAICIAEFCRQLQN